MNKNGEIVFGINPIVELLKAKRRSLIQIYVSKEPPKAWDRIAPLLKKIPIQYVSRDVLTRLAQSPDHQGVVAYASPFVYRSKPFDAQKHPFLIMLDRVQDPRNLGAIIRSAYCTGAHGIVLTKKGGSSLTATAIKASAGLAEHLEIYQAASSAAAVSELQKMGYTMYLASLDGQNATTIDYKAPLCLVIGSEGAGISPEIKNKGITITLPQRNVDISYNASVAAGILLFLISTTIHRL